MTRSLVALTLVLAVLAVPARAGALTCVSTEAMIELSGVAFAGIVVDRVDDAPGGPPGEPSSFAVIDVAQVWKGEVPAQVVLTMGAVGADWRPELPVGESVAFLARDGRHVDTSCNTWQPDWIVDVLGPGASPDPLLVPESLPDFAAAKTVASASTVPEPVAEESGGEDPPNSVRWLLLIVAVLGGALGVLGVRRYRHRTNAHVADAAATD